MELEGNLHLVPKFLMFWVLPFTYPDTFMAWWLDIR
jgi:hypothetical protein